MVRIALKACEYIAKKENRYHQSLLAGGILCSFLNKEELLQYGIYVIIHLSNIEVPRFDPEAIRRGNDLQTKCLKVISAPFVLHGKQRKEYWCNAARNS